jgi:multicomponent Na+:H+ antiporter subunit E
MAVAAPVITFTFSLLVYLGLTAGSGMIILWSLEEIIFGSLFAFISALLAKRIFPVLGLRPRPELLNPIRWFIFIVYAVGPFFYNMAKANLDVAYRVITGKIRPGIVRISPGLKTSIGMTMLANSITLTPGTLTVDVDAQKNLYVHWIYVGDKKPELREVCHSFPTWIRRIAE